MHGFRRHFERWLERDSGGFFMEGGRRGRHHGHPHHGFGRGGHGHGMFGRMLKHGDLRLVVLWLLEEKPRHGYEIIKALEEQSGGHYSPSPGVVYPTLTYLEDVGYALSEAKEGKKLYTITDAGRGHLNENRDFVQALVARLIQKGKAMERVQEWFGNQGLWEGKTPEAQAGSVPVAMKRLKAELFGRMGASEEEQKRLAEILDRATAEIRGEKKDK